MSRTEQSDVFDWQTSGDFPAVVETPDAELSEELKTRAVGAFLGDVLMGNCPSIREIKAALQVGQPKATALQAYLTQLAAS